MVYRSVAICCCCLTAAVWVATAAEDGVLLDEVVAVVNRELLTRSEVREEALLILVERKGEDGLERTLTPEFLRQVLDFLINQRVLLDEAQKLGLPPVSDSEREQLLEGFRRRFSGREGYERFLYENGLTEDGVGESLIRHLRVELLKENKLRVLPEVDDEEVRNYYEANRPSFGGRPLSMVAEAIRLRLLTQQREKQLAKWVWELRKRSEVKVLVDLAGGEGERP